MGLLSGNSGSNFFFLGNWRRLKEEARKLRRRRRRLKVVMMTQMMETKDASSKRKRAGGMIWKIIEGNSIKGSLVQRIGMNIRSFANIKLLMSCL